jgi:iron complex transport system permease protein
MTVREAVQVKWPVAEGTAVSGVRTRHLVLFAGGIALIGAFFVLELSIGAVAIPPLDVVSIILGGEPTRPAWPEIVFSLRMPRAITAVVAGAGLATAGLVLQTLFRNPLAGPWVLGVTHGAQLGVSTVFFIQGLTVNAVAIGALSFIADLSLAAGACAGAVLILALLTFIAPKVSATTLLIVGLMFQYLAPSAQGVLAHLTPEEVRESYLAWRFGEFGAVTWPQLQVLIPAVLIGVGIAWSLVKPLNAILLGETYARTVGENVTRTRLLAMTSLVGLSGVVTAFCGPVAFLDLAVPHLCRGVFKTSNHRMLLPAVIVMGALIGLAADFVVHLPWKQHVLHLDYVTALIGAPVVLWILLRNRQMRELS